MYGEIVVPSTPVIIKRNANENSTCGKSVARRIVIHGSLIKNTVSGYESNTSARYFNIFA